MEILMEKSGGRLISEKLEHFVVVVVFFSNFRVIGGWSRENGDF